MKPDKKLSIAKDILKGIIYESEIAHPAAANTLHVKNVRDIVEIVNAMGRNISAGDIEALKGDNDEG